jgi:hypothetical protein
MMDDTGAYPPHTAYGENEMMENIGCQGNPTQK